MPPVNEKKNFLESSRNVFLVLGIIALVAFLYALREVFASITISVVFFFILDPIASWCCGRKLFRRFTISRLIASIIAFLVGVVFITGFILILIPPISDQVQRFSQNLPQYTDQAEKTFNALQQKYHRLQIPPDVQKNLNNAIEKVVSGTVDIARNAAKGSSHFFSKIMLIFMIPFLTFYMLLERDDVRASIVGVFPKSFRDEAEVIIRESSAALRGYISGQLLLSVIMGVLMTVTLSLIGVKAPLLLGLIAGVTKLIPVIGIFLGCIPAALVALSISLKLALWVVLIFTVIQLLENKIILPVMLSHYVNLSPLTILLAILVGEQLGGVLGMFIATPVAAVIHVVYLHVRARYE